jgi:hypothetical protein
MKKLVFILLFFVPFFCEAQVDCNALPINFTSYTDAVFKIKNAKFNFTENINTSRSSWVRGASYYSCDGKVGYLIIKTDRQNYIHKNLPITLWNGFKNANSFGSFYDRNIRNRYSL